MALTKNVNSYVTVVEAEAYLSERIDAQAWIDAPEKRRSEALITATSILDGQVWSGTVVVSTQLLAFPRSGSYFDTRLGMKASLGSEAATLRLTRATYELALHLLANENLLSDSGSIKDLALGDLDLTRIISPSTIPPIAHRLIQPMLRDRGSNAWFRAN